MKYFFSLFLLVGFCHTLYSYSYIDSLDHIIDQKVAVLAKSSYKVDKIVYKIRKNIKTQVSLHEIEEFLENEHSVAFFFYDEVQVKLGNLIPDEPISDELVQAQQSFRELQFALGAKLYLYYLECAKQKMLYKAVKNYDALNYWQNEKFEESQSFFQKNILRSLSSSQYKERIEDNILQLKELTQQTNGFLGMILHSQKLLEDTVTYAEFEQVLIDTIRLQDNFLHVPDQCYDSCDMGFVIKKSIDQLSQFSVHLSAQYAQCQLPSHVVRHWKGYSLTAAAACVVAFIYFTYGTDIAHATKSLWDDHIEKPLTSNWNRLNGYMNEDEDILKISIEAEVKNIAMHGPAKGDETPLHEALVNTCDIVSNGEFSQGFQKIDKKVEEIDQMMDKTKTMIDEANIWHERIQSFKKEHPNMLWGDMPKYFKAMRDPVFPDVYQPDSRGIVGDVMSCIPLPGVWKDPTKPIIDEAPTPITNESPEESLQEAFRAASGELGQAVQGNSLGQPVVPRFNVNDLTWDEKVKLVNENDKIVMANPEKNLSSLMGAGIRKIEREMQRGQAIVGAMALIPVVTLVGGSMFASKTLYDSVAYQSIRTLVRKLEIFLNEIYYEAVTFEKEGHIYFLTEQLKLNVNVLTIPEQKLIAADIEALQTPSLDYVQKTNVVQRMYRTYPCLIPTKF